MQVLNFLEKYNISLNDARNDVDKKTHLASLIGKTRDQLAEAQNLSRKNVVNRKGKQLNSLSNYGSKKGEKYKVPVKGTFEYEAEVFAANEAEASKMASIQVSSISPSLRLKVGKVGTPKRL